MQTLVNSAAFAIENMQLIEDTRQRVEEMEIINSISQVLSETFGGTAMWDSVLNELMDLFPQGLASVVLYDASSGQLSLPASQEDDLQIMPPEPLLRAVVEHNMTLEFNDLVQADTRLERLGIDSFRLNLGALRAWIGVPLKSRSNETIGIISLQSDRVAVFSQRDFSLLNTVSAQLSLALDNARLLQSEQERRVLANSLIDVGRVVSSTLNIDEVFERIFGQIDRLLSFKRATILLTNTDDSPLLLTLRAVSGISTDAVLRGQTVVATEKSPLAKVLSSLEPVTLSANEDRDVWEHQPEIFSRSDNTTWMGVPLIVQSEVIGVITLENTDAYSYTMQDAKPIFALARQAAVAVRNARLHTQAEQSVQSLRDRANRLASMHYLATHISSSLSQQDIVDHATQIISDLFQADYAAIIRIDPVDGNGYLAAEHPRMNELGQAVMLKGTPTFDAFQTVVRKNRPIYTRVVDLPDHMLPDNSSQGGYAIAPLIAYDNLIGNITLGFNDPDYDFNNELIETFMTIAAQIAVALRNAELFQEALDAARLKTEFLANVSHELRTPLNAIIGYSELLLGGTYGDLNDKQLDRVERVFRSGRQLLMLIDDILDLSKIETGKMELEMGRLNVALLVQDALATIEPQAQRKALPIHVDIEDTLPPIFADGNRMRQVLVNILSNAVKFTNEGQITVSANARAVTLKEFPELPSHMVVQNSEWIQISITDTGIGIADNDQMMIFEAFTQADGSTIREYEGTGLGLAITQRLVRMHKGHIWLESELGVGSVFHVILPTMETLQRPQYVLAPDDNRPVIIIADEDELTLQLMSEFVDTDNYKVIMARSVEEITKIANQ
ncbi:MAG: GAF domain-containing protein, partial [Chloroflexota bacterium]